MAAGSFALAITPVKIRTFHYSSRRTFNLNNDLTRIKWLRKINHWIFFKCDGPATGYFCVQDKTYPSIKGKLPWLQPHFLRSAADLVLNNSSSFCSCHTASPFLRLNSTTHPTGFLFLFYLIAKSLSSLELSRVCCESSLSFNPSRLACNMHEMC